MTGDMIVCDTSLVNVVSLERNLGLISYCLRMCSAMFTYVVQTPYRFTVRVQRPFKISLSGASIVGNIMSRTQVWTDLFYGRKMSLTLSERKVRPSKT